MFRRLVRVVRNWRKRFRSNEPIICIEISKSALLHNLAELKKLAPEWGVVPVLKANAYGHGIVQVAEIFQSAEAVSFFAVDSYFEAEQLRSNGITKPLLVLGFSSVRSIMRSTRRDVSFVVGSLERLEELCSLGCKRSVHIKFDTGMHRQGISWTAISDVIDMLQRNSGLRVEGILSHFAEAETTNSELTKVQIARWNDLARRFQKEFPSIKYYHIANSAGFGHVQDIVANTGRSGIALYGVNPGNLRAALRPALRMSSVVGELRTIEKGERVGYNATFEASGTTLLATVPVGYFEGVDRRLSNKGAYLVKEAVAPIRGRVSMNISSCDVTNVSEVSLGSEVVVISDKSGDLNSVEQMARLCDTIPYEILVHVPAHLRRIVVA